MEIRACRSKRGAEIDKERNLFHESNFTRTFDLLERVAVLQLRCRELENLRSCMMRERRRKRIGTKYRMTIILQRGKKAGEEEVEKANLRKVAQLSHGLLPFALSLLPTFYNIHNRREGSTSARELHGAMDRTSKKKSDRVRPILSYSSR